MKNIKKFIVIGSGNSGAGGIHDYLLSRDDTRSPFNGSEFRLINDPNGLSDLFSSIYHNFSINKSAEAILSFEVFIKNLINSNYNKKNNLYDKNLVKFSNEFINDIKFLEYNGAPQFFFDKLSFMEKFLFYYKRFILMKNVRKIDLLKMFVPDKEEKFYRSSENFLEKIFTNSKNFDKNKNIVINQGGSFWNPVSSTKFYGENTFPILVTRDPKGIYWSMKRRNSLSYPGYDLKIFVQWYKKIMEMVNKEEFNKVFHIKYEDFFSNFDSEKNKLCKLLKIPENESDNFNLEYTKKNLFKYKDNLSVEEINYINKNLKDFIQC